MSRQAHNQSLSQKTLVSMAPPHPTLCLVKPTMCCQALRAMSPKALLPGMEANFMATAPQAASLMICTSSPRHIEAYLCQHSHVLPTSITTNLLSCASTIEALFIQIEKSTSLGPLLKR